MKQLLLFMSMVFLFLGTSCQNKELIAEGELTAITENTATVGNTTYQTTNGTTDFLLDEKLTVNGETAYVYADGNKLYVSKLNEDKISFGRYIKIGYQIVIFIQVILFIVIISISLMSIDDIEDYSITLTWLNGLMIIPTIFLIIGLCFPGSCFNSRTSPLKILTYGTLTDKTDRTKTINGTIWKISNTYPANSDNETSKGQNYAVIQNGNNIALYEAESEKQIQREIAYINQHNKLRAGEIVIIMLGIFGTIFLYGLYFKRVNRFLRKFFNFHQCIKWQKKSREMYGEVNYDDRQGYGRWN